MQSVSTCSIGDIEEPSWVLGQRDRGDVLDKRGHVSAGGQLAHAPAGFGIGDQDTHQCSADDGTVEAVVDERAANTAGLIGWPASADLSGLFASHYDAVPDGVVNDRWAQTDLQRGGAAEAVVRGLGGLAQLAWKLLPEGSRELAFPASPRHDFTTPEYARYEQIVEKK